MQAFCNTCNDFHMEKTDIVYYTHSFAEQSIAEKQREVNRKANKNSK